MVDLPAQSCLLVAPAGTWGPVTSRLSKTLHGADVWQPEDLSKPLPIAEVRRLLAFAARTGVGEKRLAIIPAADRMGTEAANALLKLLEEPPAGLSLLLLAETTRILPTVRSRLTALEPASLSATMGGEAPVLSAWKAALSSLDLAREAGREEAGRLLYLYPLVHQGIRPETVLESVRHTPKSV